jgi:hypothetical protein
MENQELLNQRISYLKNNIQEIIDKRSLSNDNEQINLLNIKKKEYMLELDNAMKELKLYKNKSAKDKEIKKVIKINDAIVYHKIKNKPNSAELLEERKINREKAQKEFQEMSNIKREYDVKEKEVCTNIPGFLFFHKDIIKKYDMCPYIILTDNIYNNRLNWLNNQKDNGKLYYDLYNKFINKVEHNVLLDKKTELINFFSKMHKEYLSSVNYELLQLTEVYIKDYTSLAIKTKKLKDKFKIIINNISNIVIESGFNINEYLSCHYGLYIPINKEKGTTSLVDNKIENHDYLIYNNIYNEKILEYKNLLESIQNSEKYLYQMYNNLNQDLYQYIYNKNINISKNKCKTNSQEGKYFNKWSKLTDDEKLDRYYSFIEYYISKYLVEPGLIDVCDFETSINCVKKLIDDNFNEIKFKDIKWNIKKGIIEKIYSLKFKEENKSFFIINKKEHDNTQQEKDSQQIKAKRISSKKVLINKETEKIINEELVIYILYLKNNNKLNIPNVSTDCHLKLLKQEFIEKLKHKLYVKRITGNDKNQINNKFDEIYSIIMSNENPNILKVV